MKKMFLTLGTGAAIGYVLGTRAGRERYETLKDGAAKLSDRLPHDEQGRIDIKRIAQFARPNGEPGQNPSVDDAGAEWPHLASPAPTGSATDSEVANTASRSTPPGADAAVLLHQ